MSQLTIWKFELPIESRPFLLTSAIFKPLFVKGLGDKIYLWAEVDTSYPLKSRHDFIIIGTGQPCVRPDSYRHIGTALTHNNTMVWHVYFENSET